MGDAAVRLKRAQDARNGKGKDGKRELHPDEQRALDKLRREAKQRGATLHSDGEGGLPPSLALGVFRRDKFRCKRCGGKQDLSLHHKGGIPASKWLVNKGHSNDPNNLVVICNHCHDAIHQEARDEGLDNSPEPKQQEKDDD